MSAACDGITIWTPDRRSFLPQTNRRLPLEALPAGGKLVVSLISESVWCMFAFMSDWSVPAEDAPWYESSNGRLMLMTSAAAVSLVVFILSMSVFLCRRAKQTKTSKGPM